MLSSSECKFGANSEQMLAHKKNDMSICWFYDKKTSRYWGARSADLAFWGGRARRDGTSGFVEERSAGMRTLNKVSLKGIERPEEAKPRGAFLST